MSKRRRRATAWACSVVALSIAAAPAVAAGPSRATLPPRPAVVAARWLAGVADVPVSRLVPIQEARAVTTGGETLWAGKFLDAGSGSVHVVYRDAAGELFGADGWTERQRALAARLPAFRIKADPALVALASRAAADAPLDVGVWLAADPSAAVARVRARYPHVSWLGDRPIARDLLTQGRVMDDLYRARQEVYRHAASAAAVTVRALGGTPGYASTSAPLLFARVPAAALARLAERAEVVGLHAEGSGWTDAMTYAGASVDANWTSGPEDQGNGVRVGVIEYYNVRRTGDLAGQVVASYAVRGSVRASPGFDHPTWVAGAIAGLGSTYRGVAPGADIVSAATGGGYAGERRDEDVVRATDWAIRPDGGRALIVNVSLGQDTTRGYEQARTYFDHVGGAANRLPVAAAGNYGTGVYEGYWVVSPGVGWNVLTVGGIDDRNTRSRTGDRMWYQPTLSPPRGSNYRERLSDRYNPHGDFEKPDLSAPAYRVRTANGISASGTSVAAPIVAGIAAQLLARRPGLAALPEVVRAIVMAGAVHRTPMPNGGYSRDHEGVGTASAVWANRLLHRGDSAVGGHDFGTLEPPPPPDPACEGSSSTFVVAVTPTPAPSSAARRGSGIAPDASGSASASATAGASASVAAAGSASAAPVASPTPCPTPAATRATPAPVVRTVALKQGQRLRVVVAWSSETGGPITAKADRLSADLDLVVRTPGGQFIPGRSFDNSHEFVTFVAPATGSYQIRIVSPRFETTSLVWGLAWAKI